MTRRFFFVHLQKTGGTALLKRLRHHFGPEAVYPLPDEQGRPEVVIDIGYLQQRFAEMAEQVEVVTGHFPLCATEVLGAPFETFTVLRDPVERTLSFLRHQRQIEPRFGGTDLEAIYDDPVSTGGLLTNHMVKMLSLSRAEMTNGLLTPVTFDEERLEQACANLAGRIDVVGLQEHFDQFCDDLEIRFGWDLGDPLFMNRTAPLDAPDGLRERIADDNRFDVRLYQFAVDLWQTRH